MKFVLQIYQGLENVKNVLSKPRSRPEDFFSSFLVLEESRYQDPKSQDYVSD